MISSVLRSRLTNSTLKCMHNKTSLPSTTHFKFRVTKMNFSTKQSGSSSGEYDQEIHLDADRAEKLDYYSILKIQPSAEKDDIKEAFRKLAKEYHPDMIKDSVDSEVI